MSSSEDLNGFLTPTLRTDVDSIIEQSADRLQVTENLHHLIDRTDNYEPLFNTSLWAPATLSHGLCGTAVFYNRLSHRISDYESLAYQHLAYATQKIQWVANGGLMGGPTGVLAVAQELARKPSDYTSLRSKLTGWVCKNQEVLIGQFRQQVGHGVPWLAYDVMNGISGNLRILLEENSEESVRVVRLSIDFLCDLVLSQTPTGQPGWWVPPEMQPTVEDREQYPQGDFNLGIAHGIAGVLGTFVSCVEHGFVSKRVMTALETMTAWIMHWQQHTENFSFWPARIPANIQEDDETSHILPTRAGWCYGTPGIAVELIRASKVLDDPQLSDSAVKILKSHLSSADNEWHLGGPMFCHGYAGTLYLVYKAWSLTQDADLKDTGKDFVTLLLDQADSASPLIFQDKVSFYDARDHQTVHIKKLDNIGLLQGSSGVALVLETIAYPEKHDFYWDRIFALS